MPKNIIDKIWDAHIVSSEKEVPDVFFIDLQLLHEVTSPQAFSMLRKRGKSVFAPKRNVATIDHSIPTDKKRKNFADDLNKKQIESLRQSCNEFGIRLLDIESGTQGVVHVTGPELGLTQPGMTIVCGDSHTSTHGAFGALAFGIGTTQISHVLETSCLLLDRPKTMRVKFEGTPSKYFSAKDAILALIRQIGVQGGTGHIIEYCGEYIQNLSMEERMTICNMSIECGARAGLIAPDETTFSFLEKTEFGQKNIEEKKEYWESLCSDADATYDAEITIDLTEKKPLVTWGTTPAQSAEVDSYIPNKDEMTAEEAVLAEKSLEYANLDFGQKIAGIPVQNVFVGSCTNGRPTDLREVAKILEGKRVADGVRMFIVPGSEKVEKQATEEGLDTIFLEAGAEFRRPGCSACLAMNGDIIPAGERCASTSNRNFVGRQGPGAITHLMSPLMAAIAAVTGKITDPEEYF
jgi:3-isopropylmalate/(R)-2-methylmalate dehydratase large subunit